MSCINSSEQNSAFGVESSIFTIHDPNHLKIAFLNPTFTFAAYQNNSFYNFYKKYYSTSRNETITSDLGLINNKKIPHEFFYEYNQGIDYPPSIPHKFFFERLVKTVSSLAPRSNITFLDDQDIHNGKLFYPNGKNAFDVIFLVHEEYATQTGYNNLKRFVSQGGTLAFTESNVLTVEVKYNPMNDSITLVKGHEFEFDGKVAKRSVEERWLNETATWLGSNFLPEFRHAIYFKDMPFNYSHTEEQYVANPNVTLFHDYGIFDPASTRYNFTVGPYEMGYGKGKVVMSSIFADSDADQDKEFFKFFKSIMLPHAIGSLYKVNLNGSIYNVYGLIDNGTGSLGTVVSLRPPHSLDIQIDQNSHVPSHLILTVPRQLFSISDQVPISDTQYVVTIEDNKTKYEVMQLRYVTGFDIPLSHNSKKIRITAVIDKVPFTLTAPKNLSIQAQGPTTIISDLGKPIIGGKANPMPQVSNNAPTEFPLGSTVIEWTASDLNGHTASAMQIVNVEDKTSPTVKITSPQDRTLVRAPDGKILVKGTSNDNFGVKMVQVKARSEINGRILDYALATPIDDSWSSWSISLDVRQMPNPILIIAKVTDSAFHQNFDQVRFAHTK